MDNPNEVPFQTPHFCIEWILNGTSWLVNDTQDITRTSVSVNYAVHRKQSAQVSYKSQWPHVFGSPVNEALSSRGKKIGVRLAKSQNIHDNFEPNYLFRAAQTPEAQKKIKILYVLP